MIRRPTALALVAMAALAAAGCSQSSVRGSGAGPVTVSDAAWVPPQKESERVARPSEETVPDPMAEIAAMIPGFPPAASQNGAPVAAEKDLRSLFTGPTISTGRPPGRTDDGPVPNAAPRTRVAVQALDGGAETGGPMIRLPSPAEAASRGIGKPVKPVLPRPGRKLGSPSESPLPTGKSAVMTSQEATPVPVASSPLLRR